MQDVAMEFREKIRLLLARDGLNQATWVEKLGGAVSKSTVWNWHQGKTVPTLDVALELSRLFNVSLNVLADNSLDLDMANLRQPSPLTTQSTPDTRRFTLELIEKLGDDVAQRRLLFLDYPPITVDDTANDEPAAISPDENTKPATPQSQPQERKRKSVAGY